MSRYTTQSARQLSMFDLNKIGLIKDGYHCSRTINWTSGTTGEKTASIHISIDAYDKNEMGYPYAQVVYKIKGYADSEWRDCSQIIRLLKSKCNYGGFKWFFQCRLYKNDVFCGRRVSILYQCGDYFACRHCASLSYDSCNKGKRYRKGTWGMMSKSWDAEDYLATLKRFSYRGRPTRKYMKYLKMQHMSPSQLFEMEKDINELLSKK